MFRRMMALWAKHDELQLPDMGVSPLIDGTQTLGALLAALEQLGDSLTKEQKLEDSWSIIDAGVQLQELRRLLIVYYPFVSYGYMFA